MSTLQIFIAIVFIFGAFGIFPTRPVEAASANIVISEVYGGGSNSGANYQNDFIELYNLGTTPVDLSTWSVQYAGATGTSWNKTILTGTIQAGGYYLIKAAGTNTSLPALPTPDAVSTLNLSGTAGKLALLNTTTTLPTSGVSPTYPGIVDFVGFGTTANLFEGSGPTPAPSNTTSVFRDIVCMDADDNKAEFSAGPQTPQNSSSPVNVCSSDAVYVVFTPTNGSIGVLTTADLVLKFNKEVTPSEGWYSLNCNLSGTHTATPSIVGSTITLNPDEDFLYSEACTLTVNGSLLTPVMGYSPSITFSIVADSAVHCGDPYTKISAIQGPGSASPYSGLELVTEGVLSADLQSTKQGFYLQDPEPDGDPATSEGMFVYTGSTPYAIDPGSQVRLVGTVTEYNGLTEMTGITSDKIQNCGPSGTTITPVELTLPFVDSSAANLEPLENMLVHFGQPLVINEYYNFDRYGEIVLSSKRLETPTNVVAPGAEAIALQAASDLDMITLDDGVSAQNPEFLPHPNGGRYCQGSLVGSTTDCLTEPNIFRGGDTVADLTAVVDYVAGSWKLIKTKPATYNAVNPRTVAPDLVAGELRISSINTLNYFITLTSAGNICGSKGGQDCRGADDVTEFTRQRNKTIATVIGMASDITGLLELENDNPTTTGTKGLDYAIADIVAGLNDAAGAGTYNYIPTGPIGTDAIKVGMVYKPARVTPVGSPAYLTSAVDPDFIDTCNRPVLAQTFRDNSTQQLFTVAINHLKSKGSACDPTPEDPLTGPNPLDLDLGDGQSFSNHTRTQAAVAEVKWLETDPTGQDSEMFLIMGDLNSYAKEDPINAIKNGADGTGGTEDDYFDLVERFRDLFRYPPLYGYVYGAQAGYLDGALANRLMASYVLDAKEWHINADEPDVLDYNTNFKGPNQQALYQQDAYRSSDHDPILVSLMLNHEPAPVDDSYSTFVNQTLTVDAAHGVLANDSDANIYDKISATVLTQPANGSVVMQADGSFTYTPNTDFVGVDTFTYTMHSDPGLMAAYENTATVTMTVEYKPFHLYLPIIGK
jgi:hypothetical protein